MRRVLGLDHPARALWRIGLLSSALWIGVVATAAVLATQSAPARVPDWLAYVFLAGFVAVPLAWLMYLWVVVLVIAAQLPAPQPWREKNLLFSTISGVGRFTIGGLLLVAGAFIGGFAGQQLDAIEDLYVEAIANDPDGADAAFRLVGLQLFDVAWGWVSVVLGLTQIVLTVSVGVILAIRVITARRAGRMRALERVMRLHEDGDHEDSSVKRRWLNHWSGGGYVALFAATAPLLGPILISIPVALALQAIRNAIAG